ncbi:MAG: twin-arginine translocase subunit TatB [Sphingomonadales bacterium]|nr:twin-arginine translocase subunit TatB [Sphingomonadales bacterium]
MLDIGWSELLLIGVVALIVVGPKDLPGMFHALGRMTAKARGMAREFSRAMEDAARDTGLHQAASGLKDLKSVTSKKSLGLEALEKATERFEKWEPKMPAAKAAATGAGAATGATPALAERLRPDPESLFDDELADEPEIAAPAPAKSAPAAPAAAKPAKAAPKAPKPAEKPATKAAPKPAKPAAKASAKTAKAAAKTPAKKGDA